MGAVAESFVDLVKDALEHLYDPAHLREHPLARLLRPDRLPPGIGPAQALRQTLLDGIEQLNYSVALPPGAKPNRAYQILVLRYVEALPFREVMAELSLSQPHFHREQRHALEALATLLSEAAELAQAERAEPSAAGTDPTAYADFDAAVQRSEGATDLGEVIRGVAPMLTDLASQGGVQLSLELRATPTFVLANRTALRQLVIGLVGYVLCAARGGMLDLRAAGEADVVVDVALRGPVARAILDGAEARDRLAIVSRLVAALGGTLTVDATPDDVRAAVTLPGARRTLLVVDDNLDAVQLVERLLADQHYTVLSAQSVRDGLALARSSHPDAILLDIMMPNQDGWEALQILKNTPATEDVPVLVCTILAEDRLARALGAAEFLRKPLTRPRLLEALARWTRAPGPLAEASRRSLQPDLATGEPEASRR